MLDDKTVPFPGFVVLNEAPDAVRRSIIITGTTRGGTSYAASMFSHLGVPFRRNKTDVVSGRYEHSGLRVAFDNRDDAKFSTIIREFQQRHVVWAWKYPAAHTDLDFVVKHVENPSFVIIFKEPVSVAYRKWQVRPKTFPELLESLIREYRLLARFAHATTFPCLLISYDKTMQDIAATAAACARFAGVPEIDVTVMKEGLAADRDRYFDGLVIPT